MGDSIARPYQAAEPRARSTHLLGDGEGYLPDSDFRGHLFDDYLPAPDLCSPEKHLPEASMPCPPMAYSRDDAA